MGFLRKDNIFTQNIGYYRSFDSENLSIWSFPANFATLSIHNHRIYRLFGPTIVHNSTTLSYLLQ